jgi:hypothetical protein
VLGRMPQAAWMTTNNEHGLEVGFAQNASRGSLVIPDLCIKQLPKTMPHYWPPLFEAGIFIGRATTSLLRLFKQARVAPAEKAWQIWTLSHRVVWNG